MVLRPRTSAIPVRTRTSATVSSIRIGCASWSIPSRHRALFGSEGSHLARYATRFNVAEINSSFYRAHAAATYARWAASVPGDFRFSVKLPRAVTHDARLQGVGPLLSRFSDEVDGLQTRLGGVLVQLPPSLAFDARRADTFFAMLRRRFACGLACEPRHASWFEPRVAALWARYQVTRVAADPARLEAATVPAGAGHWRYWRWHGSPRMYYDSYGDARLQALAQGLLADAATGREPWCIFDNTAAGHAMGDAARLQGMLAARQAGVPCAEIGKRRRRT
ncbi:DUF72 domain-containing protein [Cognatiluteimonas telluris]|uniref:DUF72 domain-containing protein n=1 Tax=Cognatiluteimonas telluris TaxID=1104775 RepID=UPI00140B5CD1|nr:DUF72 domain-containing protein [Lysobacter telluris]